MAWALLPQAHKRIREKLTAWYASSIIGRLKVAGTLVAAAAVVSGYFAVFSLTWGTFLSLVVAYAFLAVLFELWHGQQERLSQERALAAELLAHRELLATGEGWGRHDVLQRFRTTIFYKTPLGQVKPTEGWRCASCGKNLYRAADATVDHVKPQSLHPHLRTTRDNLQVLCRNCNSSKSDYDGEDWKEVTRKRRRDLKKRSKKM